MYFARRMQSGKITKCEKFIEFERTIKLVGRKITRRFGKAMAYFKMMLLANLEQ
jgi:hypothetical protein